MNSVKSHSFYRFLLLSAIISLGACKGNPQKNSLPGDASHDNKPVTIVENEDQWFLDRYAEYIAKGWDILYEDCIRIKRPETRDKVRGISCNYYRATRNRDVGSIINYPELSKLFKNLESLWVSDKYVTTFSVFSEFKKLKSLNLLGSVYMDDNDFNFRDLSELTELESIEIHFGGEEKRIIEIDLSGIENLNKLTYIWFQYYNIKIKNTEYLSGLDKVVYLDIHLDNESINFLRNMASLRELSLRNFNGYDFYSHEHRKKEYYSTIDLKAIEGLTALEEIELYGFTINNIETLNGLNNLERARIIDCYLNPNDDYSVISDRIVLTNELWDGR